MYSRWKYKSWYRQSSKSCMVYVTAMSIPKFTKTHMNEKLFGILKQLQHQSTCQLQKIYNINTTMITIPSNITNISRAKLSTETIHYTITIAHQSSNISKLWMCLFTIWIFIYPICMTRTSATTTDTTLINDCYQTRKRTTTLVCWLLSL